MKYSAMVLSLLVGGMFLFSGNVMATGEESEIYRQEVIANQEQKKTKNIETNYTFVKEELNHNALIRTYVEEGAKDEMWYLIELPPEVWEKAQVIKDEDKQLKAVYEMMADLYVGSDSWLKLNILTHQANDLYPMENVEVVKESKKETAEKLNVVLDALEDKNSIKAPIIADKEAYIDQKDASIFYDSLPFTTAEEAKEVLSLEVKELKTTNVFLVSAGIGLILIIMLVILFIKRKGR